jgi:hypothetical protein
LPFDIPFPPIKTNINKELESVNSSKEYLNTAKLKELVISVLDPEDETLDFVKDIEIYIKADDLDEIKISEKIGITSEIGKTISLDVFSEKNIAEYIKKDEFNLRIKVTPRKIVLHSVKINIYSKFRITTDIF